MSSLLDLAQLSELSDSPCITSYLLYLFPAVANFQSLKESLSL